MLRGFHCNALRDAKCSTLPCTKGRHYSTGFGIDRAIGHGEHTLASRLARSVVLRYQEGNRVSNACSVY